MRRIRSGGAVPSRWTCSSALGITAAPPGRGSGTSGGVSPTVLAARSAATAWSAASWSRAWTSRQRPLARADALARQRDLRQPDGVVDLVGLARAAAAQADDRDADGAHVDTASSTPALLRERLDRDRRRRAGGRARARPPGRRARRPCARSARPRCRRRAPSPGRRPRCRRAAAAPRSAPASRRAGARRVFAPVRWSIDSRTSTALPAVRPSTRSMSVSSADVGSAVALRDLDDRLRQLARDVAARAGTRRTRP